MAFVGQTHTSMSAATAFVVPSRQTVRRRGQVRGVETEPTVSASIVAALAVIMAASRNGCSRSLTREEHATFRFGLRSLMRCRPKGGFRQSSKGGLPAPGPLNGF